jgi:N-acetyl-1-D-myo-inositol-2-amino-2-deoxy-alpha-D-glucopyranoside deacetylase
MISSIEIRDRLFIVCPHPDDETLGTGILIQEALDAGAAVRVLFLSNGERNPIPQFVEERRFAGARARQRWGARRRSEALQAIAVLGVDSSSVAFWELPDQGLDALVGDDGALERKLASTISEFRATIVVSPSIHDLHPDHRAAANLCAGALALMARDARPTHLVFRVHGAAQNRSAQSFAPRVTALRLRRKRLALERHETQMRLSRSRMTTICTRPEVFLAHVDEIALPRQSLRVARRLFHLLPPRSEEANLSISARLFQSLSALVRTIRARAS